MIAIQPNRPGSNEVSEMNPLGRRDQAFLQAEAAYSRDREYWKTMPNARASM